MPRNDARVARSKPRPGCRNVPSSAPVAMTIATSSGRALVQVRDGAPGRCPATSLPAGGGAALGVGVSARPRSARARRRWRAQSAVISS